MLFLTFLKIGSVLYGSGYVLVAFLTAEFVNRLGWLTEQQILDAIAIGQFTPGPVLTSATFIGFILGGFPGSIIATVGIFLPAFIFVALSNPLVPRIRNSSWAKSFLDGVVIGSLGLMAAVIIQLGQVSFPDGITVAICITALFLLVKYRINTTWLILAGVMIGFMINFLRSS
jgi:chromate transporter